MQNRNIAVVFFCSIIFFSAMKSYADSGLAEQINLWTHRLIKTSKVWNAEIFGGNVVIGLIGSGMDTDHFQTINQVFTNYSEDPTNGIDDDQNGFIDDIHGWNFLDQKNQVSKGNGKSTEMTGVIASNHCAGPIRGLAPYAQIIPLQVG
ncbi:MAG: S8 family serine peptidase, partial [Pseudobdellovibrionaceae bacterium]